MQNISEDLNILQYGFIMAEADPPASFLLWAVIV